MPPVVLAAKIKNARSGPLVMQLGYMLFGILPICVSIANREGWDASSVVVARFAITCMCVVIAALATHQSLKTSNLKLLFLRGFLGGAAVVCYFVSVQETGAGMGTLLNNTHSIWASLLAVLILKEKPFRGFWTIMAIAIAGLSLVINPRFDRFSWGEFIGLLSGILAGAAILCVKELRKSDNALTILFSFAVSGLLCGLPFAVHHHLGAQLGVDHQAGSHLSTIVLSDGGLSNATRNGWLALLGVGVSSFFAQFFFTQGYKDTSVQLGSLLALTSPVIASFLGWLLLDEKIGIRFIIGAFLTLFACALMGIISRQEPDSV
jgi:drug/metabolite transporter (DMT)-like permease